MVPIEFLNIYKTYLTITAEHVDFLIAIGLNEIFYTLKTVRRFECEKSVRMYQNLV